MGITININKKAFKRTVMTYFLFRHTAVLHDGAMYIFGGMTDLNERQDCWKFDLGKLCM